MRLGDGNSGDRHDPDPGQLPMAGDVMRKYDHRVRSIVRMKLELPDGTVKEKTFKEPVSFWAALRALSDKSVSR